MIRFNKLQYFIDTSKVNTTGDIQNTNTWHSTFCQFLDVIKCFYWLSVQTQAQFVVFKLLRFNNLGGVLPESGVP